MWFGNWSNAASADAAKAAVRSVDNFNWTFIPFLAFAVYVYASELANKNYRGVAAGLALYVVHWFYEILNAVICAATGLCALDRFAGKHQFYPAYRCKLGTLNDVLRVRPDHEQAASRRSKNEDSWN